MRKLIFAVTMVWVRAFGYAVAECAANGTVSRGEAASGGGHLLGTIVKSPEGEDLAAITEVVRGPEGHVAFAVLSYWISDDTQKRVAVPLNILFFEGQDCVLRVDKEALDAAPSFVSEDDLVEPKLAGDIYRYFGIQPYWTDEGTEK